MYRLESRLGIIATCAPALRPLFSPSRRLLSQGWSKLLRVRSYRTESQTRSDTLPSHKLKDKNLSSEAIVISGGHRGRNNISNVRDERDWYNTDRVSQHQVPQNAIKVDTTFKLHSLGSSEHDARSEAGIELTPQSGIGTPSWGK